MKKQIDFVLNTAPIAQKRHRHATTRHRTTFTYDPSKKEKKMMQTLMMEYKPNELITGAIKVDLIFVFKRPKSHYRAGKFQHLLKLNTDMFHIQKPDADNLIKFMLDCMNGLFFKDDAQVCRVDAMKYWGDDNKIIVQIKTVHERAF